jgi:hypothetical protein
MPDLLHLWEFEDLKDINKNKPVVHILEEKYVTDIDPYILTFCSLVYIYCRAFYIPTLFLSSFCSLIYSYRRAFYTVLALFPRPLPFSFLPLFFCFAEVYLFSFVRSYCQNGVAGKRTTLSIWRILRVSYFGDHAGNLYPDPP